MGISYSTAKWLAPLSFAFDFAAQSESRMLFAMIFPTKTDDVVQTMA